MIEVAGALLLGLLSVGVAANLWARCARYRRYMRLYPGAPKGDVWKHVKG